MCGPPDSSTASRVRTSNNTIIQAAQFILNDPRIDKEKVDPYLFAYGSGQLLDDTLEAPSSIAAFRRSDQDHVHKLTLSALLSTCRTLSVAILAFAYLRHRDSYESLPLGSLNSLGRHKLVSQLHERDGKSDMVLTDDMWISVMWLLTTAHEYDEFHEMTCLVSDRGWSVFLSTFGEADTAYVDPGNVSVVPGIPCRTKGALWMARVTQDVIWLGKLWKRPEKVALFVASTRSKKSRTLLGERRDMFTVSIRLTPSITNNMSGSKERDRLSSFQEFHNRLWLVPKAKRCQHAFQHSQTLQLSPGTVAVRGYDEGQATGTKVIALLTARNQTTRWRAGIGARSPDRRALLRGDDCCFACISDQAASEPGPWAVILITCWISM